MSAVVEHHHVLNGRGKNDDTHSKVYAQEAWNYDKAIFDKLLKEDLGQIIEKIRVFQDTSASQRYNPLNIKQSFIPTDLNMD